MFLTKSVIVFGLTVTLSHGLLKDCPDANEIQRCYCRADWEGLVLRCNFADLRHDMRILKDYDILHLTWDLGASNDPVDPNLFHGITIRQITLLESKYPFAHNRLVFDGLQHSLESLTIHGGANKVGIPKIPLMHLKNLWRLNFQFISLPIVLAEWAHQWPNHIEDLRMIHCDIKELEPFVFTTLSNLKALGLNNNMIAHVHRNMLAEHLQDLQELDLSKNVLTSLEIGFFKGMPNLRDVYLHGNRLTAIDWFVWEPLWNRLQILTMEGNPIKCRYEMQWLCEIKLPREFKPNCSEPNHMRGLLIGSKEYCSALQASTRAMKSFDLEESWEDYDEFFEK